MKKTKLAMVAVAVLGAAIVQVPDAMAKTWKVFPGDSIQAAVDNAAPGDTLNVYPGTYQEPTTNGPAVLINKPLRMKAKRSGKDRKAGTNKVIIEPTPGNNQTDGIRVEPVNPGVDPDVDGFRIKGFTVQGFPNNGIYLRYVNDFRIEDNESAGNLENGIWPVLSANGLVRRNVSYGSDDSAMWIEASTNVRVFQNELYNSPTGLEVTISTDVEMKKNDIHDNVTGIGLYHPNSAGIALPPSYAGGGFTKITDNHVYNNNAVNTAPPGSMPASLPSGGGILVLGYDGVEAQKNVIENNNFYGVAMVDYCVAVDGTSFDCTVNPPVWDSAPDFNIIGKGNTILGNGGLPDLLHPLAEYAGDITYIMLDPGHINQFCDNDYLTLEAPFLQPIIAGKC